MWTADAHAIKTAAEEGVQLALLPEKVFRIDAADIEGFLAELRMSPAVSGSAL